MFTVREPVLLHTIAYRSSGSRGPRDVQLQVHTVRYRSELAEAPIFLATADLQGREAAPSNRLAGELLADEISVLQEFGEVPQLDLCLLCGDFYDYPNLRKLGGTGDVTPALNALAKTAAQTVAVLGNHDTVTDAQLASNISILDGNVVHTDGFVIGGVSGIVGDPKRNNRKSDTEFVKAIQRCATARTHVVMLHQGPENRDAGYLGWGQLNTELQTRSGLLVLFGHCHWPEPFHTEGRNLFCNVDGRVLVFIPEQEMS